MIPPPPYWANRFLEWYCNHELVEDLQGELYEIYESKYKDLGPGRARLYYWWLVLRSFRYSVIKRSKQNSVNMTTNHLKIAWRLMLRHKFHTFLNISGLVLGIACFILLGFFVSRELTFDRFHERSEDIYRVWLQEDYGEGQVFFNANTPPVFQDFLSENFSQLENVVQYDVRNMQVEYEDVRFNEQISIISPGFFEMFDFPFIQKDLPDPLSSPSNILLSASQAGKYFGDDDPIGKTLQLQINGEVRPFVVSGVIVDTPANSGFQIDMAISMLNNKELYGESALDAWFTVIPETYVRVRENESISSVEASVQRTVMKVLGDRVQEGEYNIGFQPLTDIHLNQNFPAGIMPVGNKSEVYILGAIALLVLSIACLNFVTMSLAQSVSRFKEVGIRKVMGAFQPSLIKQHLTESILIVAIAAFIGILSAYLLVPFFNRLTGANINIVPQWWHLAAILGMVILLGILSGFYPGMVLARWKITEVFRGKAKTGRNHFFRKGIVILQFMITAFLISSTLIMNQQLNFIQSSDLGIDYEATVSVPLPPDPEARNLVQLVNGTIASSNVVTDKLNQVNGISKIGLGSHIFGVNGWTRVGFRDNQNNFRQANMLAVSPEYFETFSIEMSEGRNFRKDNPADKSQGVILNETAVTYFQLEDPIGKQLPNQEFENHQVIGVTKDFNFSSLHEKIEPLIIVQDPAIIMSGISDITTGDFPVPKVVFRYSGKPISAIGDELKTIWDQVYPDQELSFEIVEENMRYQYASEQRMQRLMLSATILSIVIACMGLLGLTILVVNGKVKEIGIRKVVGASSANIFTTLTGNITVQLLIGFILSVPIVYYLMSKWLEDFAYRINISVFQFLISALIAIGIALLVISYHTFRASKNNPVHSLRSE